LILNNRRKIKHKRKMTQLLAKKRKKLKNKKKNKRKNRKNQILKEKILHIK
jgi:hypothetical protein